MSSPKTVPQDSVIKEAAEIEIFNSKGETIKFGTIFETQKTVIVFIRHFFCGVCQAYVTALSTVPKEELDRAETRVVVIGCGEPVAIDSYVELTQFPGEIYADPSRKLYRVLGMSIETFERTPKGQEPRSYAVGFLSNAIQSIWRGPVKNPSLIGKQGNLKQIGGDFIFGPGNCCTFASRMQHTEDHVEVAELMQAAGVAFGDK